MTTRIKLAIDKILVLDRQREDLGDILELAESLDHYGLIQPIVLDPDNRLVAGGRRLAAAKHLGWTEIDVFYREQMTIDELHELELEENVRRKDMEWQERCLNIQTIHILKSRRAALNSESWGQRETAELLGMRSNCVVNNALAIAVKLREEKLAGTKRFWNCENLSDAWRLWTRDKRDEGLALLASRQQTAVANPETLIALEQFEIISASADSLAEERARYYSNPHNPPDSFEDYWAEKQAWATQTKVTVNLSNSLFLGDSIKFMHENPERFNHVITDIPYGIDMEMLNQQHPRGGMVNLGEVEELHDVEYNLKLIADFFPAAFATTKERGFVITWCDQMIWQYMYDLAIKTGFSVQRWPVVWVKNHAMNQCVAYNTTKDTEIAIVCRKPGTTLAKQTQTSVVQCGRDTLCDEVDHPFAKPFDAWRFLVELASIEGESILDPFAGRGSGVISMLQLGRIVTGVELDEDHYNSLLENVRTLFYLRNNPNLHFQ